ncbi:MAG: hypothetical protein RJA61_363 [Candidatus Parcubacteria bacterium]|jgi:Tfp pilus assembly protein PilN
MFNLLPQEHQKELRKEYTRRRFVLFLGAFFFVGVSALVTLFPSYLLSTQEEKEVSLEKYVDAEMLKEDMDSLNERIKNIKTNTRIITLNTEDVLAGEVFDLILGQVSSGVSVRNLLFKKGETEGVQVIIAGIAGTRDGLLAFAKALENIPLFARVDVPVSTFTKERNIEFSLTLTQKKKES